MICNVVNHGNGRMWCEDHKKYHLGVHAKYAIEESEIGNKFRSLWDRQKNESKKLLRPLTLAKSCIHNSGENGTTKSGCGMCTTYACKVKGTVKLKDCFYCEEWQGQESSATNPATTHNTIRFDHKTLHAGEIPGVRFNSTIIESGSGYLYGFRNGWRGSNIYLCRLTKDFVPIAGEWKLLNLGNRGARVGREDPRLFRLNGKLHLWYIGYNGKITNVLFARINEETLEVEDMFMPDLPQRQPWEKNWAFFDYEGIAHAVYSVMPHRILRIEGNKAEWGDVTPFDGRWSGGHMRGGASPVLHNGEWYHFFHGSRTHTDGKRIYNMGCYTFSPEPPFKILRFTPDPLDIADPSTNTENYCHVLFPGGAVHTGDKWAIAHGVHDRWSEIRFYDSDWIESQLECIK